jgi:alpha-tubulin suppressor-like RCC1 family protein
MRAFALTINAALLAVCGLWCASAAVSHAPAAAAARLAQSRVAQARGTQAGGAQAGGAQPGQSGGGPTPGEVQQWGSFFGDGDTSDVDMLVWPTGISFPDTSPVVQVASSNAAQYALLADGTVWAWGQGTNGELGDGDLANSFTTPVQVQFPPGVEIQFLPTDAMPYDTALAVDTNGNAWGWGLNEFGELCLGNDTASDLPMQLPLTDVTALAGASGHAVYDSSGTVYSCGSDFNGVLGDGGKTNEMTPVPVTGLAGQDVTALVSSFGNAGALLADGQYYDWGYNAAGQLGDGKAGKKSSVPVQVTLPDPSPVVQAAEGGSAKTNGQTFVMLADGSLYAWGDDGHSQLGDGRTVAEASPEQIFPPAGVTYATVATGGNTSYAISTSGIIYAWGQARRGQLGNGNTQNSKAAIDVPASDASLISTTADDVVAN